jgi:hypothetical protein
MGMPELSLSLSLFFETLLTRTPPFLRRQKEGEWRERRRKRSEGKKQGRGRTRKRPVLLTRTLCRSGDEVFVGRLNFSLYE